MDRFPQELATAMARVFPRGNEGQRKISRD
jgi:hypothetical protein